MSHPWGHRPTRRRHRIGPNRLVTWRVAKPLLRKRAPHCGQRGQAVGRRARSASTASTRWTVSTRATCHAARISCGEGVGVFDRAQQTLHSGIIVAYAVVKA